jgi:phage tail sheath protein FI
MPEYLSPGVYVEEINTGPVPIEGVSTSTAGFVGMTMRGPVDGLPVLVTSFAEYVRTFGGYLPNPWSNNTDLKDKGYLPHAVKGFFDNGGQRVYIKRVVPSSADNQPRLASGSVSTTPALTITAINGGSWGNDLGIKVYGVSKVQKPVSSAPTLTASVPAGKNADGSDNPGSGFDTFTLDSVAGLYVGAILEFSDGTNKTYNQIKQLNGNSIVLQYGLGSADALKAIKTISTREFALALSSDSVSESYALLTLDDRTPYYIGNAVNGASKLITVSVAAPDPKAKSIAANPFNFPAAPTGQAVKLSGGGDGGVPDYSDYTREDGTPGHKTGIQALEDIEEISIVAVPGITDQSVINALIIHCEQLKYRFAIVDPDYTNDPLNQIKTQRGLYDTEYAALYFPRVIVSDPFKPGRIAVPPSGHMAGIYANVDDTRGVYKAPANEVILGILGLDLTINKREQDILNPPPYQVNVLRDFSADGRGLRVWGARCITSDSQWKYINVRRLLIFIERSLDVGTQWVVFEPNDYALWARVTQSITAFLTTVWRDGALLGQKAEEAFFVRCGLGTTMTQDDLDNGRLIVEIGVAPVKPAEFVILRISQTATGAAA